MKKKKKKLYNFGEFDRWEFSRWEFSGESFPDTRFVLFIKVLLSLLFVF